MSDNGSTNNQVPRVIKGTGFYTPMDLAPGEPAGEVSAPLPDAVDTGSSSFSISDSPQESSAPTIQSDGGSNDGSQS